jgi:hypothetical protein
MARLIRWLIPTMITWAMMSGLGLAMEPTPSGDEQVVRFGVPPLSAEEIRQARQVAPDSQSQLLAEVFPGTRPETTGGMAPLREDYSLPDGGGIFRLEGGAEVVDNRMGFRLGGGGSLYTADKRRGLRLDAATVQGDSQREMLKLLLSAGSKLGEQNQFVVTAGWLNRYAWGNFSDMGDLGDNLSQYVVGMELERQLRNRTADLSPGISTSLSTLYFKSESKTLWTGQRTGENNSSYYHYLYEYGLGGGTQYEALAGVRLAWKLVTLELQAGFRHKEYEEYLGNAARGDDAPKASARLTLNEVLGNELSAYHTWDPDLKVMGAGLRRPLWAGLHLAARGEFVKGEDRPDDSRYFLGLEYWFGGSKPKPIQRQTASADKAEKQRESEVERRDAYAKGDWLRPVRGSEAEYIQVVRQVQRKTGIWIVEKGGLADGVTVNKKTDEIVISGLPGASSIVLVTPGSAAGAFYISGGLVKITISKLPETQDIMAQIQQSDGRYSMVRVLTSHGSLIVNSVQYNTNLTDCQVAAILSNPSLLNNPPAPAPTVLTIPDQSATLETSFSLDLSAYITGSGIKGYELLGALPAGMAFDTTTGLLYGKPTQTGQFFLGLRASNSCGSSSLSRFTLTVNSGGRGSCSPVIAISTWTPNNALPDPSQAAFDMVDLVTNVAVTSSQITATVTTDASETVTTSVVNDDGGAGLRWHVNGNFTLISGSSTYTLTVTVRDSCGNSVSRSFTANIGGL